jgi:HD-like signal output (HDOD) protein
MLDLTQQQFAALEERAEETVRALALPLPPEILERLRVEAPAAAPDRVRLEALLGESGLTAGVVMHAVNAVLPETILPARSVQEACAYLGVHPTARLFAGLLRRNAFSQSPCEAAADLQRRSSRFAVVLGFVAGALRLVARDQAHLFGLLRDLGQAVLACRHPDYLERMQTAPAGDATAWIEHEKRQFGADHAVIGGVLARNWLLPEPLGEAELWHHAESVLALETPPIRVEAARLIALGMVGDRILQRCGANEPHPLTTGREQALRWLETTERELAPIEAEACALLAAAEGRALPTMRLQPLRA